MRYLTITGDWINQFTPPERRHFFKLAIEEGWTIRVNREHWEG